MSSTPEKYYHCTLWKIDIIKFPLFPSKIGCILNSQLLYLTTSEISEKQKLQKLLNCQPHVCAKHCKNWQIFDWNIQKIIKCGRFYWDTVTQCRCRAKSNVSPTGWATSRLRPGRPCTKTNIIWLPCQLPLRDRKINFRLIICIHSSTNAENLAKIGQLDFEITGQTGIVKNN